MSSKNELHRKLKEIGYEIGPFASKDTLAIVMRLHSMVVQKGIDVSKLNDLDLRKNLNDYSLHVGPVTSQTRPIYQRKLLEVITHETTEGSEDDIVSEPALNSSTASSSPLRPSAATTAYSSSSTSLRDGITTRSGKLNDISSPTSIPNTDPRVQLTRIDISDNLGISPSYPKLLSKQTLQEVTSPLSSNLSRSSADNTTPSSPLKRYSSGINANNNQDELPNTPPRPAIRPTGGTTYGLRDPYNFQNDDYKSVASTNRPTTTYTSTFTRSNLESKSSNDILLTNPSQSAPKTHFSSMSTANNTPRYENFDDLNTNTIHRRTHEATTNIESRPSKYSSSQPKKVIFSDENFPGDKTDLSGEKSTGDKMDMVEAAKDKGSSGMLYGVITVIVAILVFILYT
ncbi:unnamed protein product, partial [Didymodactylos carnosus]